MASFAIPPVAEKSERGVLNFFDTLFISSIFMLTITGRYRLDCL